MEIKEFSSAIDEAIRRELLADKLTPRGLFEPIDYTLSLSGKRIRPLLCLMASYLFSDDWHRYMPQAIALEIFHNFTLLHDDLMDRSEIRRGKPTVYKKWNDNTAVLSGDAMSILSYKYLCNTKSENLSNILEVFTTTAIDVCRGQQYDMDFETRKDVSIDEYLDMIRLKTAVLLGASLQIGALSAGANYEVSKALYNIGIDFGLAFQIQDDILDVYANQETFGKSIGGDIRNAKKTFLLLYTQEKLSKKDNIYLQKLLTLPKDKDDERVIEVRRLYDKVGAREEMQRVSRSYINRAFCSIDSLDVEKDRSKPLVELFTKLINREK